MTRRWFWLILLGALILVAGVLMLLNSLGSAATDVGLVVGSLVGVGVIVGGLFIVWSYWQRPEAKPLERAPRPERVVRRERFLGDIKIGRVEWELEDMELESWIGDVRLDLTQARFDGERAIRVMSRIGDVDIFVPRALPAAVEVSGVIGSLSVPGRKADGFFRQLSFKSPGYDSAEKRVRIRVKSIIGDVSVKHIG